MGNMNVYDYLNQIRKLDYKVKNAEAEIDRLRTLATSAGAMDYSVDIVQNAKATQEPSFVHTVEQIDGQLEKLQKIISDYNDLRTDIYNQINSLTPIYARVLYLKYFEFKNWEKISKDINYSYSGVRYLFRGAIREFRERYGECYDT